MKTRTLVSILILVLAVLIIIGNCATTPRTQEEKESVNKEKFFETIAYGTTDEVKRFLEAGADVNAKDNNGYTALMWAAGWTNEDVVKLLIEEGADVNAKADCNGQTALIYLAAKGADWFKEIFEILIEAGADVNEQDDNGYTAIMYAKEHGRTEIVKLLKEAGAK